jgi:hypothetical protein
VKRKGNLKHYAHSRAELHQAQALHNGETVSSYRTSSDDQQIKGIDGNAIRLRNNDNMTGHTMGNDTPTDKGRNMGCSNRAADNNDEV